MAREAAPAPGEVRDGLVTYPGGETVHYCVKWRGKVRKGDTKCATRSAAKTWLKREKQRWADEEHDKKPPTLREVYERWLKVRKPEVSDGHLSGVAVAVLTHAKRMLDQPITALNALTLNELRSEYLQTEGKLPRRGGGHVSRKHTEGGANQFIMRLKILINWAVEKELIAPQVIKLKKLKPAPKEKSVLWREQFAPFMAAVDRLAHRRHQPLLPEGAQGGMSRTNRRQTFAHASTACRLMLQLGVREDEARTLEWPNIDWRNKALIVTSSETLEMDAEGRPKDREGRVLRIPPLLLDHLLTVWRENGEPSEGLVLVSTAYATPAPHTEGFTSRAVASAGTAIGVRGLTPHALRRSFATAHWERGVSLKRIADMLGHADPETTRRHYIVQRAGDQAADQDGLESETLGPDRAQVPIGLSSSKMSLPSAANK